MESDLQRIVASAAINAKLQRREDIREPGWDFWELRNINMHRVIGLMSEHRQFPDVGSIQSEIRGKVGRNFKVSWWRGMAYGAVAEVSALSLQLNDLEKLVDIRENVKGDLQWLVLVAGGERAALGVHTWIEGYLGPVYRRIVEQLANAGYKVANARREKDGLMKFLTSTADVDVAIGSFGMRRRRFQDFQEPTLPDDQAQAKDP
jgi:hypothetical protein